MTDITIIGNGNMARGIATRAVAAGKKVEILGQDGAKAQTLAGELGADVTHGTAASAPQGSIVILAVPFDAAKSVVTAYGNQLAGKTIVDITNPVNFDTFDSLVVEPGSSAAEEIAALAPAGASVVKAFNTTFAGTLVAGESGGQPLDVFIAATTPPPLRQWATLSAPPVCGRWWSDRSSAPGSWKASSSSS
ncbi:NAD(P)-binding domain-containing protein [Arthrobacter sp. UYCo732]